MIVSPAFAGRRYGVYGLARSGRASVAALAASGARVWAWDDNPRTRDDWPPADMPGAPLVDLLHADLAGLAGIVVSPGVPRNTHPLVRRAEDAGVPVIGDIELFAQARPGLPPHKVVGITGTNGKSTTTALIHHILLHAGIPARLGGNIGLPVLSTAPLPAGGVYVLELSSFQIDLTFSLACDVAVLLNVSADHLDRYAGIADYAGAKARLFDLQALEGIAVIATDDHFTRGIADDAHGMVVRVSAADVAGDAGWPNLKGPHNAQNAAAAIAVCTALGLNGDAIAAGLSSYPGLPHRMERVRTRAGVTYINDSKATNPTSTAPALAAFDGIHWILGGQAKTAELDACAPFFEHVSTAYVIGEAAPLFARLLAPHMPVIEAGTLARAVAAAAAAALPGETVLLSPAGASFDQFRDYEDRGAQFRAAVEGLP